MEIRLSVQFYSSFKGTFSLVTERTSHLEISRLCLPYKFITKDNKFAIFKFTRKFY